MNSCSRSVLPWDALPVRGTLFSPALWRPFSPVPTTSFASQPSRTAASICVAPTAACPLVSEAQRVNRAQCSVALSCPCPLHPPLSSANSPVYPSHTFFHSIPQEINVWPACVCDPRVPSNPVPSLTSPSGFTAGSLSLSSLPPCFPWKL